MTDYEVYAGEKVPVKAWVKGVPVESAAIDQLKRVASMPFIHKHVAVMPDVHVGRGATVGSVIPTIGAIIPAAVGVDIGCGMMAVRLNLTANELPDNLSAWRSSIEAAVPCGFGDDASHAKGGWVNPPATAVEAWNAFLADEYADIIDKHPSIVGGKNNLHQLGTLGSGNHFIELCLDESDRVWVMLHSGSRGVGNRIGSYFIELAKTDMRRHFINLPDVDLSYLVEGTEWFNDYIQAMTWAQNFAKLNRELMMRQVLSALNLTTTAVTDTAINCHHNYTTREQHFGANPWVTRKGAVCAREGIMGIIPGSMGAKSFIVKGKGNPESFNSCSHGAGRVMSRGAAKKLLTLEDHLRDTAGVECRKDIGMIDETPKAYKSIETVMAAQDSLVSIEHTLKQILCVKG